MNVHVEDNNPKQQLRRRLKARRKTLSASFRAHAEQGFATGIERLHRTHPTGSIVAYLPTATEPPLAATLERLKELRPVWLPIAGANRTLRWIQWRENTQLAPTGPGGLLEPDGHPESLPHNPGLILVPALAVDTAGIRLGFGGGYYDSFLATVDTTVPQVACVFEHEILPAGTIPTDPWDARVPVALTERGFTQFTA